MVLTFRKPLPLLVLCCLVLLATACGVSTTGNAAIQRSSHEVAPVFREFYAELGGMETMGPAISPLFTFDSVSYQYTLAGLMVHDPEAPVNQRFFLAALGLYWLLYVAGDKLIPALSVRCGMQLLIAGPLFLLAWFVASRV